MWSELQKLRGVLIVLVVAVLTVWLAATGQLALYIHPRYDVFTIAMASVAIVGCVAALAAALHRRRTARALVQPDPEHRVQLPLLADPAGDAHDGHDHDETSAPDSRFARLAGLLAIVVSAGLALAMIVLPPATLSSATAIQRDITAQTGSLDPEADAAAVAEAQAAPDELFAGFTVREWATLLRQTTDPTFYDGKPVGVVGFITAVPDQPDAFYVSRFAITCCAVDAQPFGVPVVLPGWEAQFSADDWVRVTGEFVASGSLDVGAIVLDPAEVTGVDEPDQPYLF